MYIELEVSPVEIEINCNMCGSHLEASYNKRHETLYVDACDTCLDKEGKEQWRDGYDQGYKEGREDNYE